MKTRSISLLCALALLLGSLTVPAAALEGETQRAADALATLGLVQGTGSTYDLDAPATRAQAAVLLVRLAGAEQTAQAAYQGAAFRDVPAWAGPAVAYAAGQGWVTGVTATEFQPNSPVTANAWFTMLLRMLGYSDKAGDFTASDAAAFARRIGLTADSYDGTMLRGQVFQTMWEALTFSYRAGGTVIAGLLERGVCARSAANALGLLDQELTARQVADRHMAAVFALDLYETQQEVRDGTPSANASGFFISADGLAVTNYHSIDGAVYAEATLATGESYEVASVVYYDADIDIAVLRISRTSTDHRTTSAFAFLELAGTGDIRPGDTVYTLGNPLGLGLAVSAGVISATGRSVAGYALPCVMNTADISRGSSGGALLNAYGRVIAVTSGAYTYGNNMYLAVPVDPVLSADLTGQGWTLAEVAARESGTAA
jgi:S1-C subfamily serine protease